MTLILSPALSDESTAPLEILFKIFYVLAPLFSCLFRDKNGRNEASSMHSPPAAEALVNSFSWSVVKSKQLYTSWVLRFHGCFERLRERSLRLEEIVKRGLRKLRWRLLSSQGNNDVEILNKTADSGERKRSRLKSHLFLDLFPAGFKSNISSVALHTKINFSITAATAKMFRAFSMTVWGTGGNAACTMLPRRAGNKATGPSQGSGHTFASFWLCRLS